MRCNKTRTNISLALDGMLPPEQTRALEEHLSACDECRTHRDELLLGSRMLRATATEPSDAFEWKLQLKLNQALQEAAATRIPWEEPAGRSRFAWLRGFALSTGAGLAATVALAIWLLPRGVGVVESDPAPGAAPAVIAERTLGTMPAGVGDTAGDADRRSLSSAFRPQSGLDRGLGGRLVSSGGVFRSDAAAANAWSRGVQGRNLEGLRGETEWLRQELRKAQAQNDSLRALLAGGNVGYLEEGEARRP